MTDSIETEIKPNVISEAQAQLSIRASALLRMKSADSLDWAITVIKFKRHKYKSDNPISKMLPMLLIILESLRDEDIKEAKELLEKLKLK